jgi:hypothetical protein
MAKTSEILVPLFGLLTAAIPLVLAILALRRTRIRKTKEPLQTQSFLVLYIARIPVEERLWKNYKIRKSLKFILYMILLIGIAPIAYYIIGVIVDTAINPSTDYSLFDLIYFLLFIVNIILAFILIMLFRHSYIMRCHDACQGRYGLFKEAQIVIKSEYLDLFNKCHEVLKIMVTQVIEVNLNARLIDAFIPGTFFHRARSIVVRIQAIEGKEGIYEVLVEASSFTHQNDKHRVSVPSEESSRIINQFINLLISVSATGGTDKNKNKKKEAEPA